MWGVFRGIGSLGGVVRRRSDTERLLLALVYIEDSHQARFGWEIYKRSYLYHDGSVLTTSVGW